ncbi:MAG: hypothetical protein PHC34_04950 [Candidatus Gastranaerophilales bacterium]|nr:hypothetical protein [Candidatus Gastranaerophilales bacterium]
MVSPINNTNGAYFNSYSGSNYVQKTENTSLNSFDTEDKAIISAQAKLLSELEKFNSGQGDAVDLAVTGITSKHQVEAMVNIINTKKDMMDTVLEIGK